MTFRAGFTTPAIREIDVPAPEVVPWPTPAEEPVPAAPVAPEREPEPVPA